ncbi:MAG TPA: radical SAM protein [Candidatus Paceibacterota bacterium]|nr:radical SAM protein [Candidatus Paceibacterota bacterium]
MKTKYDSYSINKLPRGCQLCVLGKKSVLFISGVCSRNCWYCSLSKKRKNKDLIFCNEKEISPENKNIYIKDIIKEIKESNSKGIGITGGDPLLFLDRTLKIAKALKTNFNDFHIHIYLPTKLVDKNKLEKLSKYIDEVRFHPEFLFKSMTEEEIVKEIVKIRLASMFWKKQNIGIEMPMIPDKKQEIFDFIIKVSPFIGFVNINEFEISDTNFEKITNEYSISKDTYTISGSRQAGVWILKNLDKEIKQNKTSNLDNLNVHFCTANTKNQYQFKNRLNLHKILPYGYKTKEGTVIYLAIYLKNRDNKNLSKIKKQIKSNDFYFDKKKNRIILSPILAKNLLEESSNKLQIERVEEFPTFDSIEVERELIN